MVEILNIVVWPATVIIAIVLLRKGLVDLIPNLRKLKYKDLEVEFEKDAINLLATVERDVPYTEPPEEEPPKLKEPSKKYEGEGITKFSVRQLTPSEIVLQKWINIENEIKSLTKRKDLEFHPSNSIRSTADKLLKNEVIDSGTSNALIELST